MPPAPGRASHPWPRPRHYHGGGTRRRRGPRRGSGRRCRPQASCMCRPSGSTSWCDGRGCRRATSARSTQRCRRTRPASWPGTAPSSSTWTASEVLVPGPRDPSVAPLVAELSARLAAAASSPTAPRAVSDGDAGKDGGVSPPSGGGGGKVLPFEFRALEVCLEYACKSLEHETSMLEKEAYPALDAPTARISTLNLEHVRQIKCRLVVISGGVHKVRDELEHLLDDDADMAAMHLSEKAAFQAASQSLRFDIGKELVEIDEEGDDDEAEAEQGSMAFMPKVDELESLLEAYFVQIDGTLNKLSTLREYVEDTEDYINIMLDDKQNQLLQLGVVLSTATLLVTSAVVVTAVFGMNVHIALFRITDLDVFWEAVGGTLAGAATPFVAAMLYYWKNGILR